MPIFLILFSAHVFYHVAKFLLAINHSHNSNFIFFNDKRLLV